VTRARKDKLYRSFTKGLITEAGFLTYPEDSSTDELNTVISRKGNRSRREGIDFEENSTGVDLEITASSTVSEYFWRAPGNKSSLNFIVVQVDGVLYFFDATTTPLSAGKKTFTVNLIDFKSPTATTSQIANVNVSMSAGKGYLFVANEYIDPFTIEYDPKTDTIETVRIYILMRDFDGVNDGLPNDAEPSTLSKEHKYNLRNQGWVTPGTPSVQTSTPGDGTPSLVDTGDGAVGGGGVSDSSSGPSQYYNPYTGNLEYRTYEP
jgi:hypothetical protein